MKCLNACASPPRMWQLHDALTKLRIARLLRLTRPSTSANDAFIVALHRVKRTLEANHVGR